MGSKSALKMMGSLSRATICCSRERHAIIEPPKTKTGKKIRIEPSEEKITKIQSKDDLKGKAYLHHTASP